MLFDKNMATMVAKNGNDNNLKQHRKRMTSNTIFLQLHTIRLNVLLHTNTCIDTQQKSSSHVGYNCMKSYSGPLTILKTNDRDQ